MSKKAPKPVKSAAAQELANARAASLTPERRSEIARQAAQARNRRKQLLEELLTLSRRLYVERDRTATARIKQIIEEFDD